MRGVLNDAPSIHFLDATLASAFVARWCAGHGVETAEGVFRIRADGLAAWVGATMHRISMTLGTHGMAVRDSKAVVARWASELHRMTGARIVRGRI